MEQSNLNNLNDFNEPERTNQGPSLNNEMEASPALDKKEKKSSKKAKKSQEEKNPKGVFLKETRLSKGLSLENVHEATKIPMDALRAIEEGYNVKILSPFYIKGFMKIYAKYLSVDIKEVVDDYEKEKLPKHVDYKEKEFDFQQWFSKLLTKKQKQKIVLVLGILVGMLLLVKITFFVASGISKLIKSQKPAKVEKVESKSKVPLKKIIVKKEPEVKKPIVKQETKIVAKKSETKITQPIIVKPEKSKVIPQETKASKTESQSGISSIIQSSKDVVLTVRAQKNSWLTVKSDSEVVFQSTLRTGSVETWVADNEIEISGKNISYLEFELNGKMIGTLGRKDRRAKKLIVTKKGLTVSE